MGHAGLIDRWHSLPAREQFRDNLQAVIRLIWIHWDSNHFPAEFNLGIGILAGVVYQNAAGFVIQQGSQKLELFDRVFLLVCFPRI